MQKENKSSFYYPVSYTKLFGILTLASLSVSFVLFLFLHGLSPKQIEIANKRQDDPIKRKLGMVLDQFRSESGPLISEENSDFNLTELFAKQLAEQIISKNPDGARQIDGNLSLVSPGGIDFKKFAEGNPELSDWRAFIPEITDKEIKISRENSVNNYRTYLNSLYKIVAETFIASEGTPKTLDALGAALEISKRYDITATRLKDLTAPSDLKEFHKKEIALISAQRNIFQKIGAGKNDPLAALLALEASRKVDNEFAKLKENLIVSLKVLTNTN